MAQWTEKRPDMHTARLEWERSWQKDFDWNFPSANTSRIANMHHIPKSTLALNTSDSALFSMKQQEALVCRLQHNIAKEAASRFARDNFEGAWKALAQDKRQEIVLEGIYRTMCIPSLDVGREWCPDSSMQHLASRGGEEYLRMLRFLMPANLDAPPAEPIYIPHPLIDLILTPSQEQLQYPGCRASFRGLKGIRTYTLSVIIWNILLAFYGIVEVQRAVRGGSRSTAIKSAEGLTASAVHEIVRESNAFRKLAPNTCSSCGMSEDILSSGRKLQSCSKCRPLHRRVMYCSRECQAKDWKFGAPTPHRLICGKALTEDSILETKPTPKATSRVPDPDPGFNRSPALVHQLFLLSEAPGTDYVIVHSPPEPDQRVYFADMRERLEFIVMRNRALKSGDRYAVSSMYHLLCRVLDRNGLPHSVLRKQLELEYGHHIEETQNATWIPGIRLFLSGGFAKEELHQAMESLGV